MKWLASISGLLLGGMATGLWLYLGRWFSDQHFWTSIRELTHRLIASPAGDEFFQQYFKMLHGLGVYLAKTTCRVTITVLPILVGLHYLSPVIAQQQFEQATGLMVYPAQAVELSTSSEKLQQVSGEFSWPLNEDTGTLTITTPVWSETVSYTGPIVMTNSRLTRMTYEACGFKVLYDTGAPNILLVRPSAADKNPFWPYLNDIEFLFWTCMVLASMAVGIAINKCLTVGRVGSLLAPIPQQTAGSEGR